MYIHVQHQHECLVTLRLLYNIKKCLTRKFNMFAITFIIYSKNIVYEMFKSKHVVKENDWKCITYCLQIYMHGIEIFTFNCWRLLQLMRKEVGGQKPVKIEKNLVVSVITSCRLWKKYFCASLTDWGEEIYEKSNNILFDCAFFLLTRY